MASPVERRTKGANKLGPFSDFLDPRVGALAGSQLADSSDGDVEPGAAPLAPPLPRSRVNGFAQRAGPAKQGTESHFVIERIEALEAAMESLRKQQAAMEQRHEEGESIRRGQFDCLSQRVFEAEKSQRQVQERTDDAIEKARAAFQKTASDMEHERSNLMCVINQVNQNFEHLSREMAQLMDVVSRGQQELLHVQQEVVDLREQKSHVDNEMSVCVQKFDQKLEELQAHHRLEASQFQHCINMQILEIQRQLRLLEMLLREEDALRGGDLSGSLNPRRWLSQGPEADSLPSTTVGGGGFRVH
mmetsp:Transcript_69028/g.161711  ORF Transcript_69028/g.161711 Transcript_69028/m.161711 type:complete len:303 (-) Transcript_69028:50-958(-)